MDHRRGVWLGCRSLGNGASFLSRSRKINCTTWIQPVDGAAGGAGDSPGDRTGVCVQRVQNSAVAAHRSDETEDGRLETDADRVDIFAGDRDVGIVSGGIWKMAGGRGSAKSNVCGGDLFRAGILHFVFRSGDASTLVVVFRIRSCRRDGTGAGIYFAGVYADQVVPGSPGIGDG